MKINAIKAACIESMCALVINTQTCGQYLSDGRACWPVDDIKVDEKSVIALFDLSVVQIDKMDTRETQIPDDGMFYTVVDSDVPLDDMGLILDGGELYRLLRLDRGDEGEKAVLVREKQLKPAYKKDQQMTFYLRKKLGEWVVVGSIGMIVGVIAAPYPDELASGIIRRLKRIGNMRVVDSAIDEEVERRYAND